MQQEHSLEKNQKRNQKPEFTKIQKIFKKQTMFPENTGDPRVFDCFLFDFLKIQVYVFF